MNKIIKYELFDFRPPRPINMSIEEYFKLIKIDTKEAMKKANELYGGYNFNTKIYYTKRLMESIISNSRNPNKRLAIQYWSLYKLFLEINLN